MAGPRLRTINRDVKKVRAPREIVWDYKPSERQLAFHIAPQRFKLFGGAMGGGKSYALCAEAIKLSLKFPGNRGYMCRNEFVSFRRSTFKTFETICPHWLIKRHYRDERVLLFRNGSEIVYGGLGSEGEIEKLKSLEFGWFAIDEATECLEEHFLLLASRLRWKLPDGSYPRFAGLLASNPEPGWVKNRFVDCSTDDHTFVRSLPTDNPFLPQDYYERLKSQFPEEWCKRYLEGSWDVFEGQVYTEFSPSLHVFTGVPPFEPAWELGRVIDHGYRNPTCCLWWAMDYTGTLWIYDEHYAAGKTINEHARIIQAMYPEFRGITLADPSMFSKHMQKHGTGWSFADEYRENGIAVLKPYGTDAPISEISGINLVKQRLKANTIKISERCENTIKEIVKYKWKDYTLIQKAKANAPEAPVDKDNHAMDCLRYVVVFRPPNAAPPKPAINEQSLHYAILKHKGLIDDSKNYIGWANYHG